MAQIHHGRHGADREQSAAEADEQRAEPQQERRGERGREDHRAEREQADDGAEARQPVAVEAARERARGHREARERADGKDGGEHRRRADRQVQHLPAVGFEEDVLHAEGGGAEPDGCERAAGTASLGEGAPGIAERLGGLAHVRGRGVARLLFPHGDAVEDERHERRPLHHLDQLHGAEVRQQRAECERAREHADEQHHVHERDDARAQMLGRKIGCKGETGGLRGVHAGPDEQESERGAELAEQRRAVAIAGEYEQGKGQDGEAAELQHRAHPDVGHAAPAERRTMDVGAIADEGPQRREHDR